MIAEAMKNVGTEPEQIVGYLNKLKDFPGVYGDIAFTPTSTTAIRTTRS